MEILAAVICVLLTVQSLIKDAPCPKTNQEETSHETPAHQQPQFPPYRQEDQPA